MGNCKNCKYWEAHLDTRNRDWHTCEAPAWVEYHAPIGEADFAIFADAHDDSGLMAGLKTGPLFGCVKFQAA